MSSIVIPLLLAAVLWPVPAQAQSSLRAAFEAAWKRQPEAASLEARRTAAQARRRIAESWTAEPPSLDVGLKNDRMASNRGAGELQAALALPLWLPGERDRSGALAEAERDAVESRLLAAQLRLAADLRDAWWAQRRAAIDAEVASVRLTSARALASDVQRRFAAGELSRADAHQAEGSAAGAEAALAEAQGAAVVAAQRLLGLTGVVVPAAGAIAEPEPVARAASAYPALRELEDRLQVARRAQDLAAVQTRGNPELVVGTLRERGAFGSPYDQSLTLGIRVPFGSEARQEIRVSTARAEAQELASLLEVQRARVDAEVSSARARLEATRVQRRAAERRAQLARETREFYERAFQRGQSDLPTRLRVELEAYEADRQAARTAVEAAAAVSLLRQALGLLPE